MSMLRRPDSLSRRSRRGAVVIEFALVTLILIPLLVGLVDFGRAFYAYNVLAKSVRSASRYLSVGNTTDANRIAAARCIVLTGSPALTGGGGCGMAQLQLHDLDAPGVIITILTPSNTPAVNDISTGAGTGSIDLVTVSISGYPMSKITALLFPGLVLGPISSTVPHVNF